MKYAQPFSGYEILERVGAGAMGTVFKARDKKLGRIVALKVLKPSLARNERYVARLRREARIVASLNHAHIVTGYDLGAESGYHFFVMEFIEGRSLKELLGEWGMFPEHQVLDVGMQAASALDHAFRQGIIHRDIKPGNILITDQNLVKLTDMGLAKGPTDVTITRDGATVGTPQYISPEQARDPQAADIRSDLYSLGATLYHMLTGSPPFSGSTFAQVLEQVLHERAPSATELNPEVSDGLSLVIRKLLAKDPALRYQEPAELLEDLRRVERAEAPEVDARRLAQEARLAADGRRWGLAGVVGTALLAGLLWWFLGRDASDSPGDLTNAGREEFARRLSARVNSAPDLGSRFRVLREFDAAAAPGHQSVVAERRRELESEFVSATDALFARYARGDRRAGAEQWFRDPEHWREPERFFDSELESVMGDELGVLSVELPASLRAHVAQRKSELRDLAREWREVRDSAYRRAFVDFVTGGLEQSWIAKLADRDFAGARRALAAAFDSFFAREQMPMRAQLPDALREWVDERQRLATREAEDRIGVEEDRSRRALLGHVENSIGQLNERRRDLSPARSLELVSWLRRELNSYPPPAAFRAKDNPWRRVDEDLQRLEDEVRADLRFEDAKSLDQALGRAYRSMLLTGDPAGASAWIAPLRLFDPDNETLRLRHVALFRAADKARRRLFSAILEGRERATLEVRNAADSSRMQVTLSRAGAEFELASGRGQDAKALHAADVSWVDLLSLVEPAWLRGVVEGEQKELQQGVSLWLLACDDAEAMRSLDDATRAFFANHVVEPMDRARQRRGPADRSAMEMLQLVQAEFAKPDRQLEGVRAAVANYRDRFGDDVLSVDSTVFLAQVDGWIQRQTERRALVSRMQARAPKGGEIAVDDDLRVRLSFDPAAIVRAKPTRGWRLDGAELSFREIGVSFDDDEPVLSFETGLLEASEIVADVRLRFPEMPDRPRLYAFELHGYVIVLAMLRDGSAAAFIDSADVLRKESELQRLLRLQLQNAFSKPVIRVYPGAEYALRLRWVATQRRVKVSASLDGVELAAIETSRPRRFPQVLRLHPLQPLVLLGLQLRDRL